MLKLFFWLRYLRKRKIVFLSIAAVALSVSLLVVVASLFTGFIDAYEQIAVEFVGDIVLQPPGKFGKYPVFLERLEQLGSVEAAAATLTAGALLLSPATAAGPAERPSGGSGDPAERGPEYSFVPGPGPKAHRPVIKVTLKRLPKKASAQVTMQMPFVLQSLTWPQTNPWAHWPSTQASPPSTTGVHCLTTSEHSCSEQYSVHTSFEPQSLSDQQLWTQVPLTAHS